MTSNRLALTVGILLWAVACSEPRIDATNLERSSARVRRALDEHQRKSFDEALALLQQVEEGRVPGTDAVDLDGMTGPELLAEAERIALRREIAGAEAEIAHHREVLAEQDRLAELGITEAVVIAPDDGPLRVEMRVHNGTRQAIGSGFVRLSLEVPREEGHKAEGFVAFQPALEPGEARDVHIRISRGFARVFYSTPGVRLTAEFTSFESGGTVLAEEPDPERLERARKALAEVQEELAELNRQLAAVR